MLIFILTATLSWAAPASRTVSGEKLRAGCLRSDVHKEADQRRVICDCVVRKLIAKTEISDRDLAYLAKTWAEPHRKFKDAPKEADVLEDFDEDITLACIDAPKG